VWLSGNSGAGKTFTADALAVLAGFEHIDGDELSWSQDPAHKALWAGLVASFSHWFEGRPAPPQQWQPFYALQCARVRAALAAGAPNVVVSLTVYHRETRDFLRSQLPELIYVQLQCGREELVSRARTRFAEYAASRGETVAQAFEHAHKAPYTEAAWLEMTLSIMRGLMPLQADEAGCHELEVTDGHPWRALFALLQLGEPPAEVPIKAIAEINYARFKKHAAAAAAAAAAASGEASAGEAAAPAEEAAAAPAAEASS
jgi:gluconate kinase